MKSYKSYKGHVTPDQMNWSVTVHEYAATSKGELMGWCIRMEDLNPRLDLINHSPDGFSWGYNGSGPAQLALAILCDHTGDDKLARSLYQDFKAAVIAKLNKDECWVMTEDQVQSALQTIELDALRSFVVRIQNKMTNGIANEDVDTDDILRLADDASHLMRRYRIKGDIYDDDGEVIESIE